MIEIVRAGPMTTVQALGVVGRAHLGVSRGGAADVTSLALVNRAVGNEPGAAALEIVLGGLALRAHADVRIAVGGAPAPARIDDVSVVPWVSTLLRAGSVLTLGNAPRGLRVMIAFSGGVTSPAEGARLLKGSRVSLGAPGRAELASPAGYAIPFDGDIVTLRTTDGPHAARFGDAARAALYAGTFTVTTDVDRKGVRLAGAACSAEAGAEMVTEGVPRGAVQVPSSGQPIILGVDQQTTGGYPIIASVASVDLSFVGQLRPGALVRFTHIELPHAQELYRTWHTALFGSR